MYEIDKIKFGAFIAQLRKEKGLTQKELAGKLYISDKAVSKWETGHSVPDITLLAPLSELLGVTVTELLACHRIENAEKMDVSQADDLVKRVIALSEEEASGKPKFSRKRILSYLGCVTVSILEILLIYYLQEKMNFIGYPAMMTAGMTMFFGIYFWFFIKEKLPAYYDEHKVNVYVDGVLHMNMPGIYFNNHNWPYIVKAFRIWSVLGMTVFPILNMVLMILFADAGAMFQVWVMLFFLLGGLFIPPYILGRKYQYGKEEPVERKKGDFWKTLIMILGIAGFFLFMSVSGIGTRRSASRVGYTESANRIKWTADYLFLDGYLQRSIKTGEEADGFLIVIETIEGTISVEIKDEDGKVVFYQENLETGTYEVVASGKHTVRVTAKDHKGGFYIGE